MPLYVCTEQDKNHYSHLLQDKRCVVVQNSYLHTIPQLLLNLCMLVRSLYTYNNC